MSILIRQCYWLLLVAFGLSLIVTPGYAQERAGVNLTPAWIDERLAPGDTRDFEIRVRNRSTAEETYFLSVRNISGVGSDGATPIFSSPRDTPTGFEMADWVTLPTDSIVVPGGQEMTFSVRVRIPDQASPGSHFGAIFVSSEPPEITQTGAAVGFQVANIIHVRIAGEATDEANVRQFSTDRFLYGAKSVTFTTRIENTGNTLVTPVGAITINNMLGQEIASVPFNQTNQSAVFPETERTFTTDWTDTGLGFGRYEAIITAGYGDVGVRKTISSTVTFWVLPLSIILPALGVLVVLLLLTFLIARLYISRTLAQYADVSNRRLVQRRRKGSSLPLLVFLVMLVVTALFLLLLLVLFA